MEPLVTEEETVKRLTHVGETGAAHMVDVGAKPVTRREAEAVGCVTMLPTTLRLIRDNAAAKGDVLAVARLAGIMAAKRTSELIPLCHAVPLTGVDVEFQLDEAASRLTIRARARSDGKTGVEMEALTAVTVAALTVYDMCKAVDRGMSVGDVHLTYKTGGKSGTYRAE
ncbi:MAG: cyclic pyranopterin monophosphate synthase MoaC [Chloroflexi bacterium]|nr:cyclic pyranopterin monophosphate synthase MoaC [Chloroflexota bacterium]